MQDILHQSRDKVSTLRRDLLNTNEEEQSLDDSQTDEEAFSADEELKKQLEKVYAVRFPLKPDGVKQGTHVGHVSQKCCLTLSLFHRGVQSR